MAGLFACLADLHFDIACRQKAESMNILVTGGAGYVGSLLVPRLLDMGYKVTVLDLFMYGEDVLKSSRGPNLREVKGDIRDIEAVKQAVKGCDAVIHLACISNDPSFELNPAPKKSFPGSKRWAGATDDNAIATAPITAARIVFGISVSSR